jgi:DNA-binding transcriptional MerR regulator
MQEEALFNLKAVIRQTGLKPDTLRAWERRYGLPSPERSSGGHRLYSPHDVETIRWLMARQREGLSIQRAVDLWRQIVTEGRDPLQAAMPVSTQAVSVPAAGALGETIRRHREDWLAACLAFDEQRAEQIESEAFALYPLETVVLELLQKGVAEIGDGWYNGEMTVQQEHFCSSLVIRRLESLILATPPPMRPGRILVACPPEEQHIIGLLVLTVLLRRRGWEVVYLGADVPMERLGVTVRATKPTLVILAAEQLHTAARLLEAAQLLEGEGIPLAYGGRIFNLIPELRGRIPGHFLSESLALAPQGVEALMIAPRPASPVEVAAERYQRARDHFSEHQGLIDAQVMHVLLPKGIASSILTMANRELGFNIDAALALGDMRFLGTDIEWVKGLMKHHHMPDEALCTYLKAYYQIARDQLDERGEPVVSWLGAVVDGF